MINNLRFELSFKNIIQLEQKLKFCVSNKINKINIPCKGIIKKDFLNETVEFIGKNYKEIDVIYHYSLYHQYVKNRKDSYLELLNFIKNCNSYQKNDILLVSGSNKKKNFDVINVMSDLEKEKKININIGIAYNPYLKYFNIFNERDRFEKKISSGLTKSIWLQFGTDIKLLKSEISYLKKSIFNNLSQTKYQNVKFFGSILIPSRQFLARFKFRPWNGVYISDQYLSSLDSFSYFSKDLINFYFDNNITPVIETECSSLEQLQDIYSLLKF